MTARPAPFEPERLLESLQRLPSARRWWVAFSGGADSSALLHALWRLREQLEAPVSVLHVDHGLYPDSADWARHCQQFCEQRSLVLHTERIEVRRDAGLGIEAEARQQRYAVAERLLKPGEVLLTGHHADDQAETLLLNLMRGSGVQGLAGMPRTRPMGQGTLARPLLDFFGAELRAFLAREGVTWLEDSSNRDPAYDRNFVRLSLLPVMADRWPSTLRKLAESAQLVRDASDFIEWSAGRLATETEWAPGVLDIGRLDTLLPAMEGTAALRLVVRQWLRLRRAPSMPRHRLQELLAQAAAGAGQVEWGGWLLRVYAGRLWLQQGATTPPCPERDWNTASPLDLGSGLGHLHLEGAGEKSHYHFRVFARRGGEKIASLPGRHHKSVKHVLQEAGVPPWLRQSVPLLAQDGKVVAVAAWAFDAELGRQLDAQGMRLRWKPQEPVLQYLNERRLATAG